MRCEIYEKKIHCDRKSQLIQHLNTLMHRTKIQKEGTMRATNITISAYYIAIYTNIKLIII